MPRSSTIWMPSLQDIEQFERIIAALVEEYIGPDKAAPESEPPLPGERGEHPNALPEGLQI